MEPSRIGRRIGAARSFGTVSQPARFAVDADVDVALGSRLDR